MDEAEPLLREALEIVRAALRPEHAWHAAASNDLALLLLMQDRIDEAR